MIINKHDLNFLEGEKITKVEEVFLERAEKPSTTTAAGIPRGILILTNRRLFFLNTGAGESYGKVIASNLPKKLLSACVSELSAL